MTKTWPDKREKNRTSDAAGGEIAQERHLSQGRGSGGLRRTIGASFVLCHRPFPWPGSAAAVNVHRGQGAVGGQRCVLFQETDGLDENRVLTNLIQKLWQLCSECCVAGVERREGAEQQLEL